MDKKAWLAGLLAAGWTSGVCALTIDHHCTDPGEIPAAALEQAKTTQRVAYNHTSHGSQLVSGMAALRACPGFGGRYDYSTNGAAGELEFHDMAIPGVPDLSQGDWIDGNGVTPWVTSTRAYLENPANLDIDVVMWSWCSINGHDIPRYLENMDILVAEYGPGGSRPRAAAHPVTFVHMTGHAEGQGEGGFIHAANEQIRTHCQAHDRVLFDFADIEAHDPDGAYYLDLGMQDNLDYAGGHNWAVEWIAAHPGDTLSLLTLGDGAGFTGCPSCAHSDSPREATLNCVLKGRAVWWMLARLAGWDPVAPPLARIAMLPDGSVQLVWEGLQAGCRYQVEERGSTGDWQVLGTFEAGSETEIQRLPVGAQETRLFRARRMAGCGG